MKIMPVEVYSRVVGYFRPVDQWNKGKQEEFSERKEMKITSHSHLLLCECGGELNIKNASEAECVECGEVYFRG